MRYAVTEALFNGLLREYAHAVLFDDDKLSMIGTNDLWVYMGVESGLASYFSSSYRNNPRVPGGEGTETLDNERKATSLKAGPSIIVDGIYVWGGALWEVRKMLGQTNADRLLFAAWQAVRSSDIKANDQNGFIAKILEADNRLEGGRHGTLIKDIFTRRGWKL